MPRPWSSTRPFTARASAGRSQVRWIAAPRYEGLARKKKGRILPLPQEGCLMYAVIKTGGKQYRVAEGDTLQVEKIAGKPGDPVTFDQVLLVGGTDNAKIGRPLVSGAKVKAEIVAQGRGEKLIVFKLKRRKNY